MIAPPNCLILGADTPWVRGLCEALTKQGCHVVGLHFAGLRIIYERLKSATHERNVCDDQFLLVPPSYGTRLQWLTKWYLTAHIARQFKALAKAKSKAAWVVVTNPVMEQWTRSIPNERLIYWNYDDYPLYQPSRAQQIRSWEDDLVRRSCIVLCASKVQLDRFRARYPEQASRCIHFPNAVRSDWLIDARKTSIEMRTVGYVGNLGDRVDWKLVYETASACPHLRFVFVGSVDRPKSAITPNWILLRDQVASLPNVEMIGPIPQQDVWQHYRSFEIGWMPYDIHHSFNVACCPTKIFDALASGRPFVSTAVPECLLYPQQIPILHSAADAPKVFSNCLAEWNDDRAIAQLCFAQNNDWESRANWLLRQLNNLT